MDSRFSNIFNTDGCVLDGAPVSCGIAASVVNFGTGQSGFQAGLGFNMAALAQSLPVQFAPTGNLTTTLNVSGTEGRETYETVWSDYLNQWVSPTPTAYSGTAAMSISVIDVGTLKRNFGPITPDQLAAANKAISARYDYCKTKWFGTSDILGTRHIPGPMAARLSLAAGMNNAEVATRVAGIFSQESDFSLNPSEWGNDAGPAQLTGAVLSVWPWAVVDDAFGTRLVRNRKGKLAINNKGQQDGSPFDNLATLRNIAMSYESAYDLAYEYGPGSKVSRKENQRVRTEYAQDVTSRTPTYKNFFDCVLGKD